MPHDATNATRLFPDFCFFKSKGKRTAIHLRLSSTIVSEREYFRLLLRLLVVSSLFRHGIKVDVILLTDHLIVEAKGAVLLPEALVCHTAAISYSMISQ